MISLILFGLLCLSGCNTITTSVALSEPTLTSRGSLTASPILSVVAKDDVSTPVVTPTRSVALPITDSSQNCTYSAYYWQNNPNQWLTENIIIRRLTYTKSDALDILTRQTPDEVTGMLKEFFATALNILKGADPSAIEGWIGEISEWLDQHPLNSELSEEERNNAARLTNLLANFNNGQVGPGACADEPSTPIPLPTTASIVPTTTVTSTPTGTPVRRVTTVSKTRTAVPASATSKPDKATQPSRPTSTPEPTSTALIRPSPTHTTKPEATPNSTVQPTDSSEMTPTSPPFPTGESQPGLFAHLAIARPLDSHSENSAPVALDDGYSTNEDVLLSVAVPGVLANDQDPDADPLTASLARGPSNGSLILNNDGSFSYHPSPNFNGTDSFAYQAHDGMYLSNQATVTLSVAAVNDPPVANDDSVSTPEDTNVIIQVLANDQDVDGNLDSSTLKVINGPGNGSTSLNLAAGTISYTPLANFNGADSFVYQVCDTLLACDTATVTVNVTPINDRPVAVGDEYNLREDNPLTEPAPGILENDVDPDSILSVILVSNVQSGTLSLAVDGGFTYTPAANFFGTDNFTYRASDGVAQSEVVTVTLSVAPVNDVPEANNDALTMPEDTVAAIQVLSNDRDADGSNDLNPGTLQTTSQASHGSTLVNTMTGVITYTPSPNYHGPDIFSYQICDLQYACDTADVSIEVTPVNDPPVALGDSTSTNEDTPVTIDVLANDSDADGHSDLKRSSVTVTSGPGHGTTSINASTGAITYRPDLNYYGMDTFNYRVCDNAGACASAMVSIEIGSSNDPPSAINDSISTPEDTPRVIDVLANDEDADDNLDPSTVTVTSPPSNGSAEVNPVSGAITYSPNRNYNGPDSLVYQVCDDGGICDSASVSIFVTPVNDKPVATGNSYFIDQDNTLTVEAPGVLNNDSDVDSLSLTAVLDQDPAHGTLTLNANGSFTYTPNAGFFGDDFFAYHASDGIASSDIVIVSITVYDTVKPFVTWISPVPPEASCYVGYQVVILEAQASDNNAIDRVKFYRWDPIRNSFVDIAIVQTAPYRWDLNPMELNEGYNEIFARAYDMIGNASDRKRIFLNKVDRVFLPVLTR